MKLAILKSFPVKNQLFLFILFSLCSVSAALSQSPDRQTGNWLMYFGQNQLSEKFSWHTEVQYRNHDFISNIEQLLLRTGINYHINSNAQVLMGYGFIPSYDIEDSFSDPKTTEHRIYQELQLNQFLGSIKFNHRYRIEQRWVEEDYRGRFRYRLLATIPLTNKPTNAPFLAFYDEVFLNSSGTIFDRNRLYGALGYKVNSKLSFQAGILNQQVTGFDKWYLQFAVFYNPNLF
ncbi:DUF2490 domain-containing protein [Membranihabitans maritimus]|uniref:DUF2490 domain-containing protein n=1 Tax=Membranihabitans maritimus TaxID=2904244 RepID=UPI001F3DF7C8|nr:DUF2490 domain-containing protein [Membranihabitans maritimus]